MNFKLISSILLGALAIAITMESTMAVITVQIGGATRLTNSVRSRDRYHCFWDCDLVGCRLTRDDDECAYDCEKICKPKYDYSGRSDAEAGAAVAIQDSELKPKSSVNQEAEQTAPSAQSLNGDNDVVSGQTVRLHLPRNVTARNFGIWERCAQDSNTGKLVEHSFSL